MAFKILINNLTYITKPTKLIKNICNSASLKDNFRFALFCSLMTGTYKSVLCILRRLKLEDKIIAPIAGFLAGLWIIIEEKKRRQLLTVLLLSRFTDTAAKLCVDHKYTRSVPNIEMYVVCFCSMIQQYGSGCESSVLNKGLAKFLQTWAVMSPGELMM